MKRPPQLPAKSLGVAGNPTPALLGCVIVAAGLLAYRHSLSGPFIFDDQVSIAGNDSIRRLTRAWRPPQGVGVTVEGRPVLNLSFALNYAISGTRVWSYHAANLAIHLLAGLTLFGIVRRTAGADRILAAFVAALFWTVHPLQTEAVTYVVQRAESLMGLFYLLTLYCFIRSAAEAPSYVPPSGTPEGKKAGNGLWCWLSIGSCLFGMATKEVMVSAPLIVFLYDRTFVGGSFRAAWQKRRGFYLALAATWLVLAGLVMANGGNRSGSVGFGTGISWTAYALTQFPAIARYLRLVFWPHPLVFDYGTFWVTRAEEVIPAAPLVIGLVIGTLWALRHRPALGLLGMFFFSILAPTSLLPGTTQMIVEHRMYLALAAVLVPVVFVARAAAGRKPALGWLAATAVTIALIAATNARNADYRTELDLWADTVARRPGNVVARDNFGNALKFAGRIPEAIAQYEAALRIEPEKPEVHNNLGDALVRTGRIRDAVPEFATALRIAPNFAEAHNNLGNALDEIGQPEKAEVEFETALRIRPRYAEAHNNLGIVLNELGRSREAIAQYEAALRIRPEYPEAHNNVASALGQIGRSAEAIAEYEQAVRLRPNYAEARNNLGNALDQVGRVDEAIAAYEAALRYAPDNAEIHYNLGLEFERAQRIPEAASQYEAAVRLAPNLLQARAHLAGLQPAR